MEVRGRAIKLRTYLCNFEIFRLTTSYDIMEARTPCISTMHDLYLKSKPGTRSLSELVDIFYEMFSRKSHAGAIMEWEFSWVGKAIEDFKKNGITPPPDKLPQIDATIC